MRFGKSAAQKQPVDVLRQGGVRNGRKENKLRPGGGEGLKVVRIIEAEGRVPRDGDADIRFARGGLWRQGHIQPRRARRRLLQSGHVHPGGHPRADGRHALVQHRHVARRRQPQMPLAQRHGGVLAHRAEHRDIRIALHGGAQLGLVARPAHPVENDARDADIFAKGRIAQKQGRDAARHALAVDHQHHGRIQQLRHGGVGVGAVKGDAVIKPLVGLDQADIRLPPLAGEKSAHLLPLLGVEVQIVAVAPAGQPVPQRIDVIRALLEHAHGAPARPERRRQPDGDGGLARRLVRRRDEYARNG